MKELCSSFGCSNVANQLKCPRCTRKFYACFPCIKRMGKFGAGCPSCTGAGRVGRGLKRGAGIDEDGGSYQSNARKFLEDSP